MDLLHSSRIDGFCLVSSESDFTRLATRIRESALAMYGFGERKTPKPFVAGRDRRRRSGGRLGPARPGGPLAVQA